MVSAGWAGSGSSSLSATNARGRATRAHRRQKTRPDQRRRRQRWREHPKQHYNATHTDAAGHRRKSVGWEYVHVAVDDHSRLAYAEVLLDEEASTAAGFLQRASAYYRRHGITVERVLTDNGSCYRGVVHAVACRRLGIRHLRSRPYRPQTNGKAERFIRTLINGWAHAAIYRSSQERSRALDGWL